MSICFHVNGIILMSDRNSDFIKEFGELCLKYDDTCLFQMNDSGSLKFKLYARHYFMDDFKDLVNGKIDSINSGQIHFTCTDEDGSLNHPFPYYVYVEICEGNYFEQVIETRLPYDWDFYNEHHGGFYKLNSDWGHYEISGVAYWQPLPEPPEED